LNFTNALLEFATHVLSKPDLLFKYQVDLANASLQLTNNMMQKFWGNNSIDNLYSPSNKDYRFKDDAWQDSIVFDFIKQFYLMSSELIHKLNSEIEYKDPQTAKKVTFFLKFILDAMSPSNFAFTNPKVWRETLETGGENLVKGIEQLLRDIENSKGVLDIKTTDLDAFVVGRDIATTPGKVIYQNDLMQLIHYTPTTKETYETPILIIPPFINKYYILDLRPQNSIVAWLVEQGYSVFMISWVNPGKELANKDLADYMKEGPIAAIDVITKATGAEQCSVIGYCIGGTLLACTLSYLQAIKQDKRIRNATFLTTLLDFSDAGELSIFIDEQQLDVLEKCLYEQGYFDGIDMSAMFSMLRANDMVWNFFVNNYLMGKSPLPFDLLYWNSDPTRLTAAMHMFYLRNMYLKNNLIKPDGIELANVPIDLSKVNTPAFFLSTMDDHIAPWKATYNGNRYLGSKEKRFTLSASGHIAGVINHPDANKYCYWCFDDLPESADEWFNSSKRHEGSWWLEWHEWNKTYAGELVKAPTPLKSKVAVIEDAPGSYVRQR
jgi:polyhydroxyalkanoate synthase